jgi:hypothetical protein
MSLLALQLFQFFWFLRHSFFEQTSSRATAATVFLGKPMIGIIPNQCRRMIAWVSFCE